MNDFVVVFFSVLVILLACALLVFVPIATIWSFNILFNFEIPYNFTTWVAATWLLLVFRQTKLEKK